MKDQSIKLNLINGRVSMECGQAELESVAVMCGAMQAILAYECYRRFDDVDNVRNYMLDLHLSAMDDFMVYVKRGGINDQSGKKVES